MKYKLIKQFPNSQIKENDRLTQKELIYHYNVDPCGWPEYFKQVKEPLFTTLDGVEIFENDIYYMECNDYKPVLFIAKSGWNYNTSINRFSTEKSAQKWIEENKPIFSVKRLNDAILEYASKPFVNSDDYFVNVTSLKKELGI